MANYSVKDQVNGYIWRREKWHKGSFKGAGPIPSLKWVVVMWVCSLEISLSVMILFLCFSVT